MKLQLTRPLITFDIESTGTDVKKDRIIELAIIKTYADGSEEEYVYLLNPTVCIPESATAVHHITNEMVAGEPTFYDVFHVLIGIFNDSDLVTFNGNKFDIPLLLEEFNRCGITPDISNTNFIDAGNMYKILKPRTLGAAHVEYMGEELQGAHGALADTRATLNVLKQMLVNHAELPVNVADLALHSNFGHRRADIDGKFAYNEAGTLIFTNWGKCANQPASADKSYLNWMLGGSFSDDTKRFVKLALNG